MVVRVHVFALQNMRFSGNHVTFLLDFPNRRTFVSSRTIRLSIQTIGLSIRTIRVSRRTTRRTSIWTNIRLFGNKKFLLRTSGTPFSVGGNKSQLKKWKLTSFNRKCNKTFYARPYHHQSVYYFHHRQPSTTQPMGSINWTTFLWFML